MTDVTTDAALAAAAALRAQTRGPVTAPGDEHYDDFRLVFNAAIDRRPAAILRAADADDVAAAVRVAGEHGLEVAVRGGRHSFAGLGVSDGGIVIDTRDLADLEIDPEGRTAWAGSGLTAQAYTAATAEHGLVTGFGDHPDVGIAGITLGGGLGYLARKRGLTIDDLLAVELVTAEGELITADEENHPELFWALRGGGGNFGVVTRLRYRLHELGTALGGMLILPGSPEILRGYIDALDAAPEELSAISMAMLAPPMPFIPPELHGTPVILGMLLYAGDPEEGERALAPIRGLATPLVDDVKAIRYTELYEGDEGPPRGAFAVRAEMVDELTDAQLEAAFAYPQKTPPPAMGGFQFRVLGGAVSRVPSDATAYAHRERRMMVNVAAMLPGATDGTQVDEWADGFARALGIGDGPVYVNYLGSDAADRVADAYPEPTLARLAEVKRRYDPRNLFRWNVNVAP
ncbi:MAG TPA: FAD-binding oxidoreductase [Solirubrobacterales bacterium]|jgi:FAD/FMN-containing dehydrogenase